MRRNERPFGGLQLVLVGDFFQLPPVTPGSPQQDAASQTHFVFESPLWQKMGLQVCDLTEIVRQKDPVFQTLLNEARRGEISKASLKILRKRMDLPYSSLAIQPTMLFTRRAQVDHINMIHLRKLTTEKKTFTATTAFLPIANTQGFHEKHPDVLHAIQSLDNAAPYPVELTLAVGAQVMLLTNMNPEAGLVNGSRGVVVGFQRPLNPDETTGVVQAQAQGQKAQDTTFPLVQFKSGDRRVIEYHTWEIADLPGVIRKQIPLRLAYAITIHKAQGATLDCALIDVGGRTFEYGQAYVALSRVRDIDSLYIHDVEADAFRAHPKVKEFYS
jgi:ATP-dependent DNA helicase PIF1